MSSLEAHIISLVTAAAGIAVGFGLVNNELAGIIIAAATTGLAAIFQILATIHVQIAAQAPPAAKVAK